MKEGEALRGKIQDYYSYLPHDSQFSIIIS
jgi:hypothetical protein